MMHPIVVIVSWFVPLVPLVLFSVDVTTAADNLEKQTKALTIIGDFANRICETIPQTGSSGNVELSGKAKADLNEMLKKLANVGIEGAAKYQASDWKGVLQEELAGQLNKSRDCKKEVFFALKDTLLEPGGRPSSTGLPGQPQPRPEPIPTAAFAIEGGQLYEHPDGYIRIVREGDWLVVLLPKQPGMLSLTNDPPSFRFRLGDIPQGQWVQLRSDRGYGSVARPPGTNPALPVAINQSNNRLLGQWIR
jgi:hypothetical protein